MKIPDGVDMYDIARFFSRVEVVKQPRCWIYKGSTSKGRYPSFTVNGGRTGGHRFCYELFNGPIPENMVIRHTCDNPKCVNPYHLETGTQLDNMRDKMLRNRQAKGASNGRSILTEDQVRRILEDNRPYTEIAYDYKVHPATIRLIMIGRNWSHVTGIRRKKR